MKMRKPRLYLRTLKGAEGLQAYYLVYYDHEGKEKRRSLSQHIQGQPFPKGDKRLAEVCRIQAERIHAQATIEILSSNVERIERRVGMRQPTLLELFNTWAKRETDRGKYVVVVSSKLEQWSPSRNKKACHLTDDDIYSFFEFLEADLNLGRATALRYLRDIRHALDYGVQRGYCTHNVAANVKPRKKPRDHSRNDNRYLTRQELNALMSTPVEGWVRQAFLLMIYTACGPKELCQLRWDMVQKRDGREMLIIPRAKNKTLTISRWMDELAHLLPNRNDSEWILPDMPRGDDDKAYHAWRERFARQLRKWSKDANLNRNGTPFNATAYMARRTAATAINNNTGDVLLAARAIGHVNTQHTHRYARHDDIQRATAATEGLRGLGL